MYNSTMIPFNIRYYSAPVSNHDGSITVSLRFALTDEEFKYMMENGILPDNTEEIVAISEIELPPLHDLHSMPDTAQ